MTTSQQKILDSLAWFANLGIDPADKTQLALLSDTRPTSGGYKNNLGALRTAGYLTYPQPGTVQLTDAGAAIATPPEEITSAEDVQRAIFSRLPDPLVRILQVLIGIYPDVTDREALANAVGVPSTSGGYKNNLGRLRTLGLVDYPASGRVVACDVLFLGSHV